MKEFPLNNNYLVDISGNVYNKKGKCLSYFYDGNGYRRVGLGNKKYYIHRVVGLTYIPNPDNKPIIDHIDGNKINNCLSNLRWATCSENSRNIINSEIVEPNIYFTGVKYRVSIYRRNIKYQKYFKTLEEAQQYRKTVVENHNGTSSPIPISTI